MEFEISQEKGGETKFVSRTQSPHFTLRGKRKEKQAERRRKGDRGILSFVCPSPKRILLLLLRRLLERRFKEQGEYINPWREIYGLGFIERSF